MFVSSITAAVNYVVEQVSTAGQNWSRLFWETVPREPGVDEPRPLQERVSGEVPDPPRLKTREELEAYLGRFAPPGEAPTDDKPVLRALDIRDIPDLKREDIEKLSQHFGYLYKIFIKTDTIVNLKLPLATYVNAIRCTSLKELSVPNATKVNASFCTSLEKLSVPNATEVYAYECTSLKELSVPNATEVYYCISFYKYLIKIAEVL